ncbi:hypothetical protein OPT61_g6493 [Boeremia exigua]|uniref:Uncharacterized protein n=1 Tax=Boeremia exigua TaxID=749465 RepID=A0ACC2I6F0_9PLEO|nr:hypothetical protein OPT61_g6493 [Boeremia exigua]
MTTAPTYQHNGSTVPQYALLMKTHWTDSRRKNRAGIAAFFICCFFFFHNCQIYNRGTRNSIKNQLIPYCSHNPLAEDVLVVLKTGATEVLEKLPAHLDTTLRCIPNYVIYSDYEEDIEGQHIFDVFDDISPELKDRDPDFEVYRQLKARGREGLSMNGIDHDGSGPIGMLSNPAWKLDKFKFLPMIDRALHHRPQTKCLPIHARPGAPTNPTTPPTQPPNGPATWSSANSSSTSTSP